MDKAENETPVESAEPAAEAPASFSEIHASIMAKQDGHPIEKEVTKAEETKPKAEDKPEPKQAEPAPQKSAEVKAADKTDVAKPQDEDGEEKEKAEPASKTIPKHEREKYRLRKQRDAAEEKAKALEAKLKELGVEDQPEQAALDPEKQAEFRAKTALSRKHFVKTYGEDKLKELVGEDSTWMEIEERAKSGDHEAVRLHQRALDSDDPFEEIQTIVEDEKIFEEYGTRSVAVILAQALEQQSNDLEKRLQAEQAIRHQKPGKPVKSLGSVPGKTPEAQKVEEANRPFSIREFYPVP